MQKRIKTGGTKRAGRLVKIEKDKQKQKSDQAATAMKQNEDGTTSRGSAGRRPQGAKKRKAIADASAKKAKVKKERGELREALVILEEQLGTGTQYNPEDGTRPSRAKKPTAARVLRSVARKKTAPPQEHGIVDLDAEGGVAERVVRLLAHQAGDRASSSPENHKTTRQSPRLCAKYNKSEVTRLGV